MRRYVMRLGVIIRWSTRRPPVNGAGYDLWDGDKWLPITAEEYQGYVKRNFTIHVNPPWANRG
jgi:hypothetical protein